MTGNAITEARRLYDAGDHQKSLQVLLVEMWDHGQTVELRTEINRLFPITPEVLESLEDFEARLNDDDAKICQKAAKQISNMGLSASNKNALNTLRHPETVSLLVRHLHDEDPVVQEHMVIALAMTFQRYTRDERAFEPLLAHLKNKKINTRAWASIALMYLGDRAVEFVLPMIDDEAQRVRESAFAELSMAIDGGGHFYRQPMGHESRRKVRDAILKIDRKQNADYRISAASLLAKTAEPEDLPALKEWQKKDGSKHVKELLQTGIDRLEQY